MPDISHELPLARLDIAIELARHADDRESQPDFTVSLVRPASPSYQAVS
jgi:hypothetical protein